MAVDYDSIQGDDREDDSKAWYQEEELHQTEKDLEELEDKNEHVCHLCKQPFALRAILLQHLVTCRVASGMTGKRIIFDLIFDILRIHCCHRANTSCYCSKEK